MAMTRMQAVEKMAKEHGIVFNMIDDYLNHQIKVRGRMGDAVCDQVINKYETINIRAEHMDDFYASVYMAVIRSLIDGEGKDMTNQRIIQLEAELAKYKDTVKNLSFQLEMNSRGGFGAVVKEDEVRRLALEQAAEHLMDHGVITSGKELVEVCEQIKKLQRHDMKLPEPPEGWKEELRPVPMSAWGSVR